LSWTYFNASKDHDSEGNGLLRWSYKKIGEDIPHIIIIVGRLLINYILVYDLFVDIIPLNDTFMFFDWTVYSTIFIFAVITSLYTFEFLFNLVNNIRQINMAIALIRSGKSVNSLVNQEKPEVCMTNPNLPLCDDKPALESTARFFIKIQDAMNIGQEVDIMQSCVFKKNKK
jgi:hypothetical protein